MAKNGIGVLIGIGKPKGGDVGGPPDDPDDMAMGKAGLPADAHEAAETPEYEASEDSGASMLSQIEDAGNQFGLDASQSHHVASVFLSAMAKALSGGGKPDLGSPVGGGMESKGQF